MGESIKAKKLLKQIQQRVNKMGASNRARWTVFSVGTDMSPAQFVRKLVSIGVQTNNSEVALLWKYIGITSSKMQFPEFVKMLQTDSGEPDIAGDPNEILKKNRKDLILKLVEADTLGMGTVTPKIFLDICSKLGCSSNDSILSDICTKYDPQNSGNVNYFIFLAELCQPGVLSGFAKNSSETYSTPESPPRPRFGKAEESPVEEIPRPKLKPIETILQSPRTKSLSNAPDEYFPDAFANTISIPKSNHDDYGSGSRTNLDPLIFGKFSVRSQSSSVAPSGARQQLDPAIFGQKPTVRPPPEQKVITADDIKGADHLVGLSKGQLLNILSKQISRISKGSRQVFAKWKGQKEKIEADDIRNGLARDANIVIPMNEIQSIVNDYGGQLTMSSFTRMIADGSRYDELTQMEGTRKETDDEAALNEIASQIHGTEWEDIIMMSTSALDASNALSEFNISVPPNTLHYLASKLGKTGLVNSLKSML